MNFLFCGHDFKFLTPVMNYVSSLRDVNVQTLPHKGHKMSAEEIAKAEELNVWADIVFCEWALGNAVWFSQHKRPGQLLVVRMHAQEYCSNLPYLKNIDMDAVDAFVVICPAAVHYMNEHYPQMKGKVHLIYNPLDIVGKFSESKKAYSDYTLGFLGMVPWIKRPDLAFKVFCGCASKDSNFTLRIRGKRPEDYAWMKGRAEEMAKYEQFYSDVAASTFSESVHFDGYDPNPGGWYAACGFMLSSSDHEGSHQAVAEGMAQGAIPIIRDWNGASDLYPTEYVVHGVDDAVAKINELRRTPQSFFSNAFACREYAFRNFEARTICQQFDDVFSLHPQWTSMKAQYSLSSMCIAQVVWIPAGVHNGYRVRVSKFSAQYRALGMRTVMICLHDGKASEEALASHRAEFEQLGCHAYTVAVENFFSWKKFGESEESIRRMIVPILETERVDVIQAHAIYCARVAEVLKRACPQVLFSTVFHGVAPEEAEMSGARPETVLQLANLERFIMSRVDFANFVSRAMGAHYLAKYGILKPSCVVPSGLRAAALRKNFTSRDVLALPKGRPILGYVGTMVAWQCKDEMFALFGEMHRRYPDIYFAVLTPSPDQPTARALLEKNGIGPGDFLLTEVAFADVSRAVSQFNAGVMLRKFSPVNQAASPTKFGEMVAAGVPMVATDGIGDYSDDVRKNDFGFIVPLEELNAGKFSAATCAGIKKLLDERRNEDPAFVAKTQKFCEENLIWEDHVAKLAEWYRRLKYIKVDGSKAPLPKGNEGFLADVMRKVAGMLESNGGRYYTKIKTRIGVICDQFYWDSVFAAADFKYIGFEGWKETIKDIDCLLFVSTWSGLKKDWGSMPNPRFETNKAAFAIIAACKARKIPVIFYSKEDPPSYETFLPFAKACDCVFTSCAEVMEKYRHDCGHDRVYPMRFGINPVYHNPVGMRYREKEGNVIFSGSWMQKFEKRCADFTMLFHGVRDHSKRQLNIVDRNYELRGDVRYSYPAEFRTFQSPAIPHDALQKVHKLYDWALNINAVTDSQTMFANRVYELQASGNLLVSNYSIGVSNTFPMVFTAHESEEVGRMLSGYTDEEIYERQVSGVRRVMTGETCYDRIAEMLNTVGIKASVQSRKVLVVVDWVDERVQRMFDLQNYPDKVLKSIGAVTESDYAQVDVVAFFDAQSEYDAFYLEDMVNAFKYADCDYVTKAAYYEGDKLIAGPEHDYVNEYGSRARTVFWRSAFALKDLLVQNGRVVRKNGYSIDRFNYRQGARRVVAVKPKVSVIVAVYNNGWFLYGRAFASLQRSSLFDQMEVILVDDGSTDGFTRRMIRHLEFLYPDKVRSYFFEGGGSGSASRPRNKGVELARGEYIMILDPDNEYICDALPTLLAEAEKAHADFAFGNTFVRKADSSTVLNYYKGKYKDDRSTVIRDCNKLQRDTALATVNIQVAMTRRSFMLDNHLEEVVGGAGEDTFVYQQMLDKAKVIVRVPILVEIYYADREGSVVNDLTERFFNKYYLTEMEKCKWFAQAGLMDVYVAKRFVSYIKSWHFDALSHVAESQREICTKRLYDIIRLYEPYYHGGDRQLDMFWAACRRGDYIGAYEAAVHKVGAN